MGYKVVYSDERISKKLKPNERLRLRSLIAIFLLVFALTVRLTWNDGAEKLRQVFIPGEASVTEAAFSGLLEDLRNGNPLDESLRVFCSVILHEAS